MADPSEILQMFTPDGTSDFERGTSAAPLQLAQGEPAIGEPPHKLKQMSSADIDKMTPKQRRDFYKEQLGPYTVFVFESASKNVIPPQLLATVILTELSDINIADIFQEAVNSDSGSLGIAQITVKTAIEYKLTEEPGEREAVHQKIKERSGNFSAEDVIKEIAPAARLRQPKVAIEAAARYIKILTVKMTQHLDKPWQRLLGFRLPDIKLLKRPEDFYKFIVGKTDSEKEERAALIIAAAYNSEGIIVAEKESSIDDTSPDFIYHNAVTHGQNAMLTAKRLAEPPPLFHLRF